MNGDKDSLIGREKYWKELTDTEKIERMRKVVLDIQQNVENLRASFNEIYETFINHEHRDDGLRIVKKYPNISEYRWDYSRSLVRKEKPANADEVYF